MQIKNLIKKNLRFKKKSVKIISNYAKSCILSRKYKKITSSIQKIQKWVRNKILSKEIVEQTYYSNPEPYVNNPYNPYKPYNPYHIPQVLYSYGPYGYAYYHIPPEHNVVYYPVPHYIPMATNS